MCHFCIFENENERLNVVYFYVFSFVKFVVHYSATEEFSKFSTNQLISKFFKIYTLLGLLDLIRCLVDHFYRTIEHFFKNIYPKYTASQYFRNACTPIFKKLVYFGFIYFHW
jgi:hypothetical protein